LIKFLKKYSFIKKLKFKSKRERYVVSVVLSCVVIFLAVMLVIKPFLDSQRNIREEIPVKINQLEKYRQVIAGRSQTEKTLKQFQEVSKRNYQKLLSGDTPPLGAANLQDILNTLSAKSLISINSEKVLDAKVLDFFTQIPVQIEFITTMTNLTNFLYDIENYEKALVITNLNIRAASYRDPKDVRVAIVVAGLMRGTNK
jgi:hypothetical protein